MTDEQIKGLRGDITFLFVVTVSIGVFGFFVTNSMAVSRHSEAAQVAQEQAHFTRAVCRAQHRP